MIKNIYNQSVKYLMLGGGLLLIGIIVNIHDLLSLLPAIYQQGAMVTIIACISSFINISTGVNTSILFTSDKYVYGTYLLYLLFVLGFALNVLLIPRYGIIGAVLATAFSTFVYNALKFLMIWKLFKLQPYNFSSLKILLVIVIVFVVSFLLPSLDNAIVSIGYKAIAITVIYLFLTYRMNIIPEFHKYIPFIGSK